MFELLCWTLGASHGFASRGDLSVEEIKWAKENSFRESVKWLKKYLV